PATKVEALELAQRRFAILIVYSFNVLCFPLPFLHLSEDIRWETKMEVVQLDATRIRPTTARLANEEQVLAAARRLAGEFALAASKRDAERILPFQELDALSQSGLLGI